MQQNFFSLLLILLVIASPAHAENYVITLKNHVFNPRKMVVPAQQKIKITVKNEDNTPANFRSWDLNRDKALDPESKTSFLIGPLDPGQYRYYDDYHHFAGKDRSDSTYGFILAK